MKHLFTKIKGNKFAKELGEELGKEAYSQAANYVIGQVEEVKKGKNPFQFNGSNVNISEKVHPTIVKEMQINTNLSKQNTLLNKVKLTEVTQGFKNKELDDFNEMWIAGGEGVGQKDMPGYNAQNFQTKTSMSNTPQEEEKEVNPVVALLIMALLAGIVYTVVGPPAG